MIEGDDALAAGGGVGGAGGDSSAEARLLHRVDERVNAVVIINSSGIIQMANKV